MSIFFIDGMDLYDATADFLKRWDAAPSSGVGYATSGGRFGGRYANTTSFSNNVGFGKTIPEGGDVSTDKYVASMAAWFASQSLNVTAARIMTMGPAFLTSLSGSLFHIGLGMKSAGILALFRGATEIADSGSAVMVATQWQRITMEIYLHASAGTAKVWVDGVLVIDFIGNTINTALSDPKIRGVNFGVVQHSSGGEAQRWDDLGIWSSGGDGPAALSGDWVVNTLFPTANGDETDGTPSAGTLAQCVDDIGGSTEDADYIVNTTVGDIATFQMQDLGEVGDVIGVNVHAHMRGDAPGLRKVNLGVRVSGVNHFGSTDHIIPSQNAYNGVDEAFAENPETAAAWTATEVNALQAGYQLVN